MQNNQSNQKYFKYFIKGSGNSYCLLNGSSQDQIQFIQFQFRKYLLSQDLPYKRIRNISIAGLYLLIILENGKVLKLGIFSNQQNCIVKIPQFIKLNIKIIEISSGWDHSILKSSQNQFYGLGSNKFNQISLKQKKFYLEPEKIQFLKNNHELKISHFVCGFRQSYFVTQNIDQLYGCGESKKYQLGQKSMKTLQMKKLVLNNQIKNKVKKIQCSKRALFLLDQNKNLYVLGYNQHNIFNHSNDVKNEYFQTLTKINQDIQDFSCGWSHIIIVKRIKVLQNNQNKQKFILQSYGRNNFGQLGRSGKNQKTNKVDLQTEITQIQSLCLQAGTEFTFCINKGDLYGWGWNQHQNVSCKKQEIVQTPQRIKISEQGKCSRVWTYPAITIVELIKQ